jgi:hypothetical protein
MPNYLFDQKQTQKQLKSFFTKQKPKLNSFGSTVNQTFEAYVFAKVIQWYTNAGYTVTMVNPKVNGKKTFRLKFSTRGAPNKYSYAEISLNGNTVQLRHQLRISTASHHPGLRHKANICCDISIINDNDLSNFSTDDALDNNQLISFGEVKHMSAFAELIASFIGLVYELAPANLNAIRIPGYSSNDIAPFLYVSGLMNPTAKGIHETIVNRQFNIDIYSHLNPI